ncbi:Threonine/homoserine/homoserine lactone efflux protein [Chromohalobacter canadensis]|uniref:Threonine/homoserine/homoserine lactone efflux protein n=1 Tax=Chromohalobacter canadensis TaxID=141389 RepID=A0A285VPQ3_9GAMM|nr:LysE family translocator [Chromohalobacter canadensis]SOC56040.1 Threonine/homoserine/homoserine lactone efflux protein [Chromohalobacter canadensis]
MISLSVLSVFVPTFFMVSLTPGLCMTLSMTLGMTIGVRRAMWMMLGELVGVGLVAVSAVIGVATLMLRYPEIFAAFKWLGGAYLIYLGVMMWRSKGRMAIPDASDAAPSVTPMQLIVQGFVTAVANPKGWAFFIALLPPFLDAGRPMAPQLAVLVGMILTLELTCLLIYAGGGRTASRFLRRDGNVRLLNRVAGSLMVGVGVWLALG